MRVAICIATYRRPAMLADLLRGVAALEMGEFATACVMVIIVDNDIAGSAAATIDAARFDVPFAISYAIETRRGIAHARNSAIATALAADADVVAMIDDDEIPSADWLLQLLRTQAKFGADAVYGPVVSRFAVPPPGWVTAGRFFERTHVPTGEMVRIGTTGNVLLTRRVLERRHPPFDPRFGLTGGEDTLFFLELQSARVAVISCAEAVVVETVPATRTTIKYVLRRAYAAGASYVAAERCVAGGSEWTTRRTSIALTRIASGMATACLLWPFGKHHFIRGLQTVSLGSGMLAGLRGVRFEHYLTAGDS